MITYEQILKQIKPYMTDEEREYCELFELTISAEEYADKTATDIYKAYMDDGEYRDPARLEKCINKNIDAMELMNAALGHLWQMFGVNVCSRICSEEGEISDKVRTEYDDNLKYAIFEGANDTAEDLTRKGANMTKTWINGK